jgi:2-polyprenyl-6-methoxyphenol hydroxylase-like FAD-dependent oxidoreductase
VTLAEATQATGLLWDDDRVVGVRLKTSAGERSTRARTVIGSDGCNSFVARAVAGRRAVVSMPPLASRESSLKMPRIRASRRATPEAVAGRRNPRQKLQ